MRIPSGRVTSNHSETVGESQRHEALVTAVLVGGIVASSLLVVYSRVAPCHKFELLVRSLVVQGGHPIVAVINFLVTRGSSGVLSSSRME